jgi:hypothetical protein
MKKKSKSKKGLDVQKQTLKNLTVKSGVRVGMMCGSHWTNPTDTQY